MWSNCVMPKIKTEIKIINQKNIWFKIKFSSITIPEDVKWPIYNGMHPKLPLFIEIVYAQSNTKKITFDNISNLIEIPLPNEANKLKILYKTNEKEQYIEGTLKATSRRGSLLSMNKARILIYNPIKLIYYQNLIMKKKQDE